MAGGILAGFVTSFVTAAVELSATIVLTAAESQAPLSYGIYLYMQSIAGRGPGAALGVLAIIVVAAGTYVSHLFVERAGRLHRPEPAGGMLTVPILSANDYPAKAMAGENEIKVTL
jgi:iron(III) transport system permease protein